jgi:hypothetical protein
MAALKLRRAYRTLTLRCVAYGQALQSLCRTTSLDIVEDTAAPMIPFILSVPEHRGVVRSPNRISTAQESKPIHHQFEWFRTYHSSSSIAKPRLSISASLVGVFVKSNTRKRFGGAVSGSRDPIREAKLQCVQQATRA